MDDDKVGIRRLRGVDCGAWRGVLLDTREAELQLWERAKECAGVCDVAR